MEALKERDELNRLAKAQKGEIQTQKLDSSADVKMAEPINEKLAVTENQATEKQNPDSTEELKSDATQHENWIPPEKRRPEDEFFDLKSMVVLSETDITGDGSITKLVIQEGKGALVDMDDLVYYLHETRFDNG